METESDIENILGFLEAAKLANEGNMLLLHFLPSDFNPREVLGLYEFNFPPIELEEG